MEQRVLLVLFGKEFNTIYTLSGVLTISSNLFDSHRLNT